MNGYDKCFICGEKKSINSEMILCSYKGEWICNDHKESIAVLIDAFKEMFTDPAIGVLKIIAALAGVDLNED